MRKLLILLFALAVNFTISAQEAEMAIVPQYESLSQAWQKGKLKHGENSHEGTIGGKTYSGVWSYWYIKFGNNPENIQLAPLKADRISKEASKWRQPVIAFDADKKTFKSPALIGGNFFIHQVADNSRGGGYSFTNPLKDTLNIIIEGNLRFHKGVNVFIYKKNKNGTIILLASNAKENAIQEISIKHPNGRILTRTYLKLLCETELSPGEQIFIIAECPEIKISGKSAGKLRSIFQPNDRWGRAWQPTFVAVRN